MKMTTLSIEDAISDAGVHIAECDSCGAGFLEIPKHDVCLGCGAAPVHVLSKSERFNLAMAKSRKSIAGQASRQLAGMHIKGCA